MFQMLSTDAVNGADADADALSLYPQFSINPPAHKHFCYEIVISLFTIIVFWCCPLACQCPSAPPQCICYNVISVWQSTTQCPSATKLLPLPARSAGHLFHRCADRWPKQKALDGRHILFAPIWLGNLIICTCLIRPIMPVPAWSAVLLFLRCADRQKALDGRQLDQANWLSSGRLWWRQQAEINILALSPSSS